MKENLNANIKIVNLMKGISSLVVILLIVLITITMFSLIYITTLGLLKESGESTQETFEKKQQAMSQKFAIDNANQNAVYIRNEGEGEISGKSLEFFVNNQHIDVISAPDSIASKKIGTFVLNATQLASFSGIRTELKVTGAGIGDTKVVMFNTTVTVPTTSTTTTLPGPIYLSVVLDTPPEGSSNNVAQNNTFVVRANVTCVGTGSCGNVNGTLWYNASGNEPDNPISIISGSVPLSIVNVFNVLDLQVISGADDAEEYDSGASFFPAAGNVRIASDTGGFQTDGGFRFTNVTIPQGAVVRTATFQGYIFVASTQDDANFDIFANDVDNANNFSAEPNVRNRIRTTVFVPWVQGNLGSAWTNSPNISSVVQEVINRPGWNSGNALMILGFGKTDLIRDYKIYSYEGDPSRAAKLHVEFESESSTKNCGSMLAGQTCQLTWTVNATGLINSNWNIDTLFVSDTVASNDTGNAQVNIKPPIEINVVDFTSPSGNIYDTSIAIGNDSYPVISYRISPTGCNPPQLNIVKCGNAACSAGKQIITLSSPCNANYHSIAIGNDSYPVISYYDTAFASVRAVKCNNANCSVRVINNIQQGLYTSTAIGSDGFPVISYAWSGLKVAKCNNADCSASEITTVDSVGGINSIKIGTNGFPVISYSTGSSGDLKVAKCNNADCSASEITTVDSVGDVGNYNSIAISGDGFPVISYYDNTNQDLKVAKQVSPGTGNCTGNNNWTCITVDSAGGVGTETSIAIGSDGFPVIAYSNNGLRVAKCNNANCSSNVINVIDSNGRGGNSIAISSDGFPVISYNVLVRNLTVVKCYNLACNP